MSTPVQVREKLLEALDADFVGPFTGETETLPLSPSRWYLTGFLVPQAAREPDDPTADESIGAGEDEEEEGEGTTEPEPKRKNLLPASMGLSVLLPAAGKACTATVSWADYRILVPDLNGEEKPLTGVAMHPWERIPRKPVTVVVPLEAAALQAGLAIPESNGLVLVGNIESIQGVRALSLFVVNRREPGAKGRYDEAFAFQVKLAVRFEAGLLPRPDVVEGSDDWDEQVANLQYRLRREYAVGHGVSATTLTEADGRVTTAVTKWIPSAEVSRVTTREIPALISSMEDLAELADGAAARKALQPIVDRYGEWIETARKVDPGTKDRRETRDILLARAETARKRIDAGIALLEEKPEVFDAFRIANEAMAEAARRRSPKRYEDPKNRPSWFAFQLAFVLLNLPSVVDPTHPDRENVELIYFPTGGGKTEAYLGVIAVTLVLRRLQGAQRKDKGFGVAVLLRYTLRLLTLDQLSRAATLICALEMRRSRDSRLGSERFSVGLWVGRTATANTLKDAAERINAWKINRGGAPFPLSHCPWCRAEIKPACIEVRPNITNPQYIIVACENFKCDFTAAKRKGDGLPVLFVDEQVYRELPCFLLATVDKFAMLPWRGETAGLFGRVRARIGREFIGFVETASLPKGAEPLPQGLRPPDLVVQDELHLISGPLGTMVGLYETAIETLATREENGKRLVPKILASTATVRRAREQTQALFGRRSLSMFPPPGIDEAETFFATIADGPGRLYAGVAANGRALKLILLRTYVALLAAGKKRSPGGTDDPADAYLTLAGYFNSLRELGGMRRLVDDEVRNRLASRAENVPVGFQGPHPYFANREIGEPLELTSRESTAAITAAKAKLGLEYADPAHADVLLASNMISVGVDIDRLGLMVIAGQPKTSSEYIQASSRVGRDPGRPGLVVTVFNVHKPRDRSHYERFETFHRSFYRFVEATSVTPFSGPALERGLAAVLVAISRLSDPTLTPSLGVGAIDARRASGEAAVSAIARRAGLERPTDSAEHTRTIATMEARGRNLLDAWTQVVKRNRDAASQLCYSRFDVEHPGTPLLFAVLDPADRDSDAEKFAAPTSMRDVEEQVHLWIERRQLRKEKDDG